MPTENLSKKTKSSDKNSSFKTTAKSVGAAFFGVQSNKNRDRDFSEGKLSHFIIAAVIGVAIFIGVLIAAVSLVLP
ncbi:DUF2970 domain-containing protein [Colwellia sp. BRX10-4]|uniref:DUF2970 domain-containing protein n=2 Tax=unclassified Colwellia TaxID=196834 RepID=UPI0015F65DEC|nr:DUF2970 domain-containing protein [Colwellia sp. BRX10-4]MBA6250619.1 DUF2970 domain-containing protein [Colwellia sp. MB3u-55]MBA6398030.1 DUF2970 domain-containing protein [Colwellia sp. BRX10-4]